MTKQGRSPNDEKQYRAARGPSSFVIGTFLRHSGFVIRHSPPNDEKRRAPRGPSSFVIGTFLRHSGFVIRHSPPNDEKTPRPPRAFFIRHWDIPSPFGFRHSSFPTE